MLAYQIYQREINDLLFEMGWCYWSPLTIMGRLFEEGGELSREINHIHGGKKKKANEPVGDIETEIGDIFYTLACFANDNGYLLDRAHWISSWKRSEYGRTRPLSALAELSKRIGVFIGEVDFWYRDTDAPQKFSIISVEEKLGDVLHALEHLTVLLGFTIDKAVRKSIDKVTVRDKDRFLGER